MLAILAASPDYSLLVEIVCVIEGVDTLGDADATFDAVALAAVDFPADSVAAQLAESCGLRFAV